MLAAADGGHQRHERPLEPRGVADDRRRARIEVRGHRRADHGARARGGVRDEVVDRDDAVLRALRLRPGQQAREEARGIAGLGAQGLEGLAHFVELAAGAALVF